MSARKLTSFRYKLSNGLTVLYLYTQNDPISAAHLFLPRGAAREKDAESGITSLMWSLILKGTKKRSARQLAEDIESIGASIGAGATHDYSEISCHAVSEFFPNAMSIFSEALFRPAFVESEIEKEKTALIAAIRSKKESIFTVANEELGRQLFGAHPYARPSSGTEESVNNLTADSLRRWHKATVHPKGAVLSIASDFPPAKMLALIRPLFGADSWSASKTPDIIVPPPTAPTLAAAVRRDEPFEQAYLLVGYAGPTVKSPHYVPLKIMNACLGGGMSARLFQSLREKEGLGYDVGSYYASKKLGTAFVVYIGLQLSRMEDAKRRIAEVLDEVRNKKIPSREIEETKRYLRGTYVLDHQTNSQRSHYLGWWETLGLGVKYDETYLQRMKRITNDQVREAARSLLSGPAMVVEVHPKKRAAALPS